jgi:zinc protease
MRPPRRWPPRPPGRWSGQVPTTWVIVGDVATMKPKIEALNLGQVTVVDVNGNPVQ